MNLIYGLLVTCYILISFFLMLIILVQKTKGSMGLGGMGGGSQLLFGGSGGQDIFQKTTWAFGALFMLLSFSLALMKSYQSQTFRHIKEPVRQVQQLAQ